MEGPSSLEMANKKQFDQQKNKKNTKKSGEGKEKGQEKNTSKKPDDKKKDTDKKNPTDIASKLPKIKEVSSLQHFCMFMLLLFAAFIDLIDWIPLATDVIDWILDIALWAAIFIVTAAFEGLVESIFIRSTALNSIGFLVQIIPVIDTLPAAVTAVVLIWLDMKFSIFDFTKPPKDIAGAPSGKAS